MRSRSHRMTSSDPKDDWVDGSWTVDCVCGVDYDDGEEMVDCDDCGVWVHTRCSRYVKSEKSFACDKCKGKNSRNDSAETEVAQLLVELPAKTMRMENLNRNRHRPSDDPPPRRPFKLWAETPMEYRVHVQGIPGGHPALFSGMGMSSICTPQLWKSAGYVPKKFNFQYREFPCWARNEDDSTKDGQESENPIDKGANVLFSLSKETVMAEPINTLVDMNERGEQGNGNTELGSKEVKKLEGDSLGFRHLPKATLKERCLLKPSVIYSSKKKSDLRISKDCSGKKRSRDLEENANTKSTVIRTSNAKEYEFHEDKIPTFIKNVNRSIIPAKSRHTMSQETQSVGKVMVESQSVGKVMVETQSVWKVMVQTNLGKPKNIVANEHPSEAFYCDTSKDGHGVLASAETSSKSNSVASLLDSNGAGSILLKVEDVRKAVDNMDGNGGHLSASAVLQSQIFKPPVGDTVAVAVAPKVEGSRISEYSNGDMLPRHEQPTMKVETKEDHTKSLHHMSESGNFNDSVLSILQSSDDKVRDVENSSEAVSGGHEDHMDKLLGDHYQHNQELKVTEGCSAISNSSSKPEDDLREVESMSGEMGLGAPPVPSQRKMVVCVGKSHSIPSNLLSKSSIGGDHSKPVNTRTPNLIVKQHLIPNNDTSIKKDHVPRDVIVDENGFEMPRKYVKERTKSSGSSALKTLPSSKTLQCSVSKHNWADAKDPVVYTSSRASLRQNAAGTISSGESVEPLRTQSASLGLNKTSSGLLQRGEKFIQPSVRSPSKVTLGRATHPPIPSISPATLSDEELALLLHQELNSSPRVPRVPRVRQAGSLPQLASPTGTSLLKRTSSFGGKDHSSVSRRKCKDDKDGSNSVHEVDYEAKKDRIPSSPSQRKQNSGDAADALTRKKVVNESPEAINLFKKNIRTASSETTNSVPSSSTDATGQNSSSVRNSPCNISDDNTSVGRGSAHRTLPGLISEIMSKGRRMTYEELCNEVLPHWNNLRKHNGERYAYSSHFQAVLDCLRNRTEWAQLVDRGPKTNASRKRRKIDSEQLSFESEDEEGRRTENEVESKNLELHREDVPKGKRKARKRRLALQGRGIKDVRKMRKVDVSDDDEISLFSNSSEEGLFSDSEFQGGETCPVETEDSASSDVNKV